MGTPPRGRAGAVAAPPESPDLLPILVRHKVLNAEQAERVRRMA
jgi:hypothetical protein